MLIKGLENKEITNTKSLAELFYKALQLVKDESDNYKEHLIAIGFDPKLKVIYVELVSLGSRDSAPVHVNEIYRMAILKNAPRLALGHNHPDEEGVPHFSKEDKAVTKVMKKAADILDVEFIDHIIINNTGDQYASARDEMII